MNVNRRDFLKLSGAALASGVVAPSLVPKAQFSSEDRLGILYDSSKCVGCRACQEACKRWNDLPAESDAPRLATEEENVSRLYDAPRDLSSDTWTLIKLKKQSETEWHFMNYQCMHCADAVCVTVCPTGALYKDGRGFTAYDESKCIGCGYCTQFCPYGVPHLREEDVLTGEAKVGKCTFCQDRVYGGLGGPFCATSCPVGALEWGSRSELLQQAKDRVEYLKGEGFASAQLYGEHEAGGLGRLSIIFGEPSEYGLPVDFTSLTVAQAWQRVIQPLGAVAMAGSMLGALVAFFVSRRYIRMQEVD
jgi:formate dehydrogenase iron-sulfur subunit